MNDSRAALDLIWNGFYRAHIMPGIFIFILLSLTGLVLASIALAKRTKPIAIPIPALVLGLYGAAEQVLGPRIAIMP